MNKQRSLIVPDEEFWKGLDTNRTLYVPWPDEVRQMLRRYARFQYDCTGVGVTRARAVIDREMGRRMHALRETKGLDALGFRALADYAAERLDVGSRTAQELARVGGALEALPVLRKANDEGLLTPSHIREVTRVATPHTEQTWKDLASRLSVREVCREVRKCRKAREAAVDRAKGADGTTRGNDAGNAAEPAGVPERTGGRVTVRVQVPPFVRAKFKTAVEHLRKFMHDRNLSEDEAARAIIDEFRVETEVPPELQRDPRARADVEIPEIVDSSLLAARPKEKDCCHDCGHGNHDGNHEHDEPQASGRARRMEYLEKLHDRWSYLEKEGEEPPPLPGWLREYGRELPGRAGDLDREIRELESLRRELDGMTGLLLLIMGKGKIYRELGFADLEHYAAERLGLGASTARRLQWVAAKLYDVPEIREAYYRGEIGLCKVVQLLRVRFADDMTAWLERAKKVTVRRLEQEVTHVLLRVDLAASKVLNLKPGQCAYEAVADGEDLVCSTSALQALARKPDNRQKAATVPLVPLRISMDPTTAIEWILCMALCKTLSHGLVMEWQSVDRMLDAFFAATRYVDARRYALNHKVFERDGWTCQVPGCRCRGAVHAHHIWWRHLGGPDAEWNLITVCLRHHKSLIHKARTIEVKGTAPHRLSWRIGVKPDGSALLEVGSGEQIRNADPPPETPAVRYWV